MTTSTHYTAPVMGTMIKVIRKAGNVQIGTVKQLHRGWEADHGMGVRIRHTTRAAAIEDLINADLAVGAQGYKAGDLK